MKFSRTPVEAMSHFLETSLGDYVLQSRGVDEIDFQNTLAELGNRTPAYSKFLRENKGEAPPTTKANYIYRYPLPERCLDGNLATADIFSVSSGTTATPVIWPRSLGDEARCGFVFEQIFRESFRCHERKTLALICFPLGIWVGGLHTMSSVRLLALKGYPVTVLAPGTNVDEMKRSLSETLPFYEQIVLCGYPPFLRDVLDELAPEFIDPDKVLVKLVLAGEAVSESWRDSMTERITHDPLNGAISLYGTADAGPLACETEDAIRVRRILSEKPTIISELTGLYALPSVFQYQPGRLWFEQGTERLTMSVQSTHPLFRYQIGDLGAAFNPEQLAAQTDLKGISGPPFVLQSGRADNTVAYFGSKIYPEHTAEILDRLDYRDQITGRFTLVVNHSRESNERLIVIVESRKGTEPSPSFLASLEETLEAHLTARNSEFANYVPSKYHRPRVVAAPFQDKRYFERGRKQVYVSMLGIGN